MTPILLAHHQPDYLRSFASACRTSCDKLVDRLHTIKEAILNEFRGGQRTREHLLQLALNEAEALAWETDYPHLVFPVLAREKAQAIAAWETHQQFVRRGDPVHSLSA